MNIKAFFSATSPIKSLSIISNKESIYSKVIFSLQAIVIGLILFLLPLEYPSFQFETHLTFNNFLHGARTSFYRTVIYYFPSDILIILTALFSFHKWRRYLFDSNIRYLLFFLISIIIAQIIASTPSNPWINYKVFNLFCLTFLSAQLCYILSENTKKKVYLFFFFILFMSLLQGILATIQYFSQRPIGLKMFETFSLFTSTYHMPDNKLWLLDYLFSITRKSSEIARAYGTLTHSNVLGGFLFFSSFISYYFFYITKKCWIEALFGVIIFFQFFSICLSFSRAAIIAYLIGAFLWFIFFIFPKTMKDMKEHKKLIKLASLVFFTLTTCFILFYPQFVHRGGLVNYNGLAAASDNIRINSIYVASKTIYLNPFFGVGLENSQHYFKDVAASINIPLNSVNIVHNIFLLVGVETGLIGLSFYFLFIYSSIKEGLKNLNPLTITLLSTFIGLLFIGCCDFYLWRFPSGKLFFFITSGMLNALIKKSSLTDFSKN